LIIINKLNALQKLVDDSRILSAIK